MKIIIDKKRALNILDNTKYLEYKEDPAKGLQTFLNVNLMIDDLADGIKAEKEEIKKKIATENAHLKKSRGF